MNITKIQAREILDSRGNPTIETTVWAGEISGTASVPSGASTGVHEAWELRDGDPKRYGGAGVLKACRNVNTTISKAVKGMSAVNQKEIDERMIKLDGTENKSKLGANAILSVSMAAARLGAKLKKLELYEYLRSVNPDIRQASGLHYKLPTPLFNVINGGKHADSGMDIQEFFIIPQKGSFATKLRMGSEVFHALKKQLAKQKLTTAVGDEGGFAPHLGSNEEALRQLDKAIVSAGYKLGVDFKLGLDAAASEFFDAKKRMYNLKASKLSLSPEDITGFYAKWLKKYPIEILEDGCAEDDFEGWKKLTSILGEKVLLVGDDIFVTNPKRIMLGIEEGMANAVLIKLNQIGTVTETLDAMALSEKNHYKTVISHRSGETPDTFIADLAVATNAPFIKTGAPSRGERVAKYNRLMEIESLLDK